MIGLRRVGEIRSQQIDHRRNLIMIPRRSQLLHYALNLHKPAITHKKLKKKKIQNPTHQIRRRI